MEEFEVIVTPKAGVIETNFADIIAQMKVEMSAYENLEVTEENLADCKKDLAFLRKVYKSVDDKRKAVKKSYMQPYEDFEKGQCKELLDVVSKPINEINAQIKEFDEKRIATKRDDIQALYNENIEEYGDFIPFLDTLEDNWLNVSYKAKDYLYHLSELKVRVKTDLEVIHGLSSEIEEDVIKAYKASGLAAAIQRNTQYLADKARVEEKVKTNLQNGTVKIEQPLPVTELNDMVTKISMVHFIVPAEDADHVEQILAENGIIYRRE